MKKLVLNLIAILFSISLMAQFPRTKVIIEEGTGTWWATCGAVAVDLEQLIAEGSEIAVIGYHLNDDYTNIYSEARAEYYGMVGLPHVVIDGTQSFEYSYDVLLERYEERINISSNYWNPWFPVL